MCLFVFNALVYLVELFSNLVSDIIIVLVLVQNVLLTRHCKFSGVLYYSYFYYVLLTFTKLLIIFLSSHSTLLVNQISLLTCLSRLLFQTCAVNLAATSLTFSCHCIFSLSLSLSLFDFEVFV